MSKCSKCGSKVSFWNEYSIEDKSYCKSCGKAKEEREKKELEQKENQESERITPMYCKKCGRRYNVQGNLGLQLKESIISALWSFIIGIGFISWKRAVCPYCDGKLKRYNGQKLNVKNFSWAEPKAIKQKEYAIREQEDKQSFIRMIIIFGILVGLAILYLIIRQIIF